MFNCLLKRREAIIHPQAGVTRDRKLREGILLGQPVYYMDTGGVFQSEEDPFNEQIKLQVMAALEEADLVLFIVEATGITGGDEELATLLRNKGIEPIVVGNKIDRVKNEYALSELYQLGFAEVIGVAAEHNRNINSLRQLVYDRLNATGAFDKVVEQQATADDNRLTFALIGRPNVGKSSLVNKILNNDRTIVSPVAGTTRDSIEESFEFKNRRMTIIDTAGLRRRSKVNESIEYYSTLRAKQSINKAALTVLLLEPDTLITEQDKKICDIVAESGKGLIFVINKWDTLEAPDQKTLRALKERMNYQFPEYQHIPIVTMSALTGRGIKKLLNLLIQVYENFHLKIETSELNRFTEHILKGFLPSKKGKQLKIYYAVQTGIAPPGFTFFLNDAKIASHQYRNYIKNNLRRFFPLEGVPIFIHFRDKKKND